MFTSWGDSRYVRRLATWVHISDAAGSVLNRKTEPKCQKLNQTFF